MQGLLDILHFTRLARNVGKRIEYVCQVIRRKVVRKKLSIINCPLRVVSHHLVRQGRHTPVYIICYRTITVGVSCAAIGIDA